MIRGNRCETAYLKLSVPCQYFSTFPTGITQDDFQVVKGNVCKLLDYFSAQHLPFFVLIYYLRTCKYFAIARWFNVVLCP